MFQMSIPRIGRTPKRAGFTQKKNFIDRPEGTYDY